MDARAAAIIQEIESQRNAALAQLAITRGDLAVMGQQVQEMGVQINDLRKQVAELSEKKKSK